jgi:hypothetical protein
MVKPVDRTTHAFARAVENGEGDPDASALGPPDERVLGDIAHEMGNHLHKLYYWTDYLRSQVAGRSEPEAAAVEMLAGAVERLETFMRMILEYFAPARLCFTKVKVADLVDGLAQRIPGRRLRCEGLEPFADTTVFADAGLLGHAVRTVFERAAGTLVAEDEMVVRVTGATRREYRGVEVEFCAGASATTGSLKSGIEMAVAEKFLLMHGAELSERESAPRSLVVFLPLYA